MMEAKSKDTAKADVAPRQAKECLDTAAERQVKRTRTTPEGDNPTRGIRGNDRADG